MNKEILFWLSIGNLIVTIFCLFGLLFLGIDSNKPIIIEKGYLIFLLPVALLSGFQFAINYFNLTDKEKK